MFICLEGVAGAGKTTQSLLLKQRIDETLGTDALISKAFERERKDHAQAFIQALNLADDDMAVMFLFQALHAAQYTEVSKALSQGQHVIADRWRESFFAYHTSFGPLAGRDSTILATLDTLAFRNLEPDLTLHMDVSPEVAHQRYVDRERNEGALKTFDVDGFTRFRDHYRNAARLNGWTTIDASRDVDSVHENIWASVQSMLRDTVSR